MPKVWPSSTLTTPSLPTFSIASAITLPISSSPAEIVADAGDLLLAGDLLRLLLAQVLDDLVDGLLDAALQRQRVGAGGDVLQALADDRPGPAAVAVVVPSPATSLVAVATSRTSWAPWFSKTSSTSISRAMVTPSLVIVGRAELLVEHDVAALRAERHLDRVGDGVDAGLQSASRASSSYFSSL